MATAAPLSGVEGHDREVRQINLQNEWSVDSWTADDSCGVGCAQLDNFNWFLPADEWVGDLPAPESQVDLSDSESEMMLSRIRFRCRWRRRLWNRCALWWSLRRDLRRAVIPAVMPMLAAAPQAAFEVAQTRPRGDCSMNLLLPVDGSIEPFDDDAPDVLSSRREPAELNCKYCFPEDQLPPG